MPLGCSKELLESFHHERSLAFVQKPFFRHSKKELLKTPSREELQRKRLFLPFGRNPLFWIPDSVRFWYVPSGSYRCAVLGSSTPKITKKTRKFLFSVISVHLAVIARYLRVTMPKMGDFLTVACHGGKSHKTVTKLILFLELRSPVIRYDDLV